MGSLSITHWLIVLVVVVLIFGTKKLKNAGKDLGEAVRGFKEGMKGETDKDATPDSTSTEKGRLIEGEHSEDPTKKS